MSHVSADLTRLGSIRSGSLEVRLAQTLAEIEAALNEHGKIYEFHSYEGAGHGFFASDRTMYRPEAATDGWQQIWTWFDRYLAS